MYYKTAVAVHKSHSLAFYENSSVNSNTFMNTDKDIFWVRLTLITSQKIPFTDFANLYYVLDQWSSNFLNTWPTFLGLHFSWPTLAL